MVSWADLGLVLFAVLVGGVVFPAIAATAGQPEAQKTVYAANDLASLIDVATNLPEDVNFQVKDSINGTAEISDKNLIVQGKILKTPEIEIPKNIDYDDNLVVSFDNLYVSKVNNKLRLESLAIDSCINLESNELNRVEMSLSINDISKNSDEAKRLFDYLKNILQSKGVKIKDEKSNTYGIKIQIVLGLEESIIIAEGANRKHSSMACFLTKETNAKKEFNKLASDRILIQIKKDTNIADFGAKIIRGIESYYE